MGFTRYYTVTGKLDPEKFKEYSKTCKFVCEKLQETESYKLGDWEGNESSPIFANDEIVFNGIGDESHETFDISIRSKGFQFTKTRLKPYDTSVCACLFLAKKFFRDDINTSSDGNNIDDVDTINYILSLLRDEKINIIL